MSDASNVAKSLRERLGGNTEDRLGKALSELLENPLLTGAIGRAFDAREKAAQAQEVAMGALNIPSAADIERLTRRLRSVSHRLEGIEDGVDRLDRALTPSGVEARLAAIEAQLAARVELEQRSAARCGRPTGASRGSRAGARTARRQRRATPKQAAARRVPRQSRPAQPRAQDAALEANRPRARQGSRTGRRPRPAEPDLSGQRRDRRRAHALGRGEESWSSMRVRPPCSSNVSETASSAADRHAFARADREQRRRLHLHRERARARRPAGRARRTGRRSRPRRARAAGAASCERPRQLRVGARRARPRRARARCRRRRSPRSRHQLAERERGGRARRRCRRGSRAARPARSARSGRSPPRGRPCRWPGSSAARRRARRPCSPTGRGGG